MANSTLLPPLPSKLWSLITKKWKDLVCLWNISSYNSMLFLDCLASLMRSCVYCLQVSCGDFLLSNWLCCHWLLLTIVYWCYNFPVCCEITMSEFVCLYGTGWWEQVGEGIFGWGSSGMLFVLPLLLYFALIFLLLSFIYNYSASK